jgi:hypothetical protein
MLGAMRCLSGKVFRSVANYKQNLPPLTAAGRSVLFRQMQMQEITLSCAHYRSQRFVDLKPDRSNTLRQLEQSDTWHMNLDWKDILDASEKLFRIVAVTIGASWIYFNWLRGRTFVPRLQLNLSGKLLSLGQRQFLLVTIQVSNVGSSIVQLRSRGTGLKVVALQADSAEFEITNPVERKTTAFPVLEKDFVNEKDAAAQRSMKNIEPGTAINEQKLIVVNTNKYNAFRLELKVFAFGGRLLGRELPDSYWNAIAVATADDLVPGTR